MERKRLYRSRTDSVIAGVCGGLGEYFEVDATIIRIIFVILAIWGGIGIILYIIGILIMPYREGDEMKKNNEKNPPTGGEKAEEFKETLKTTASDIKSNIENEKNRDKGSVAFGLILLLLGIMFLMRNFFSWFDFDLFWPVILILVGIWFIVGAGKRRIK